MRLTESLFLNWAHVCNLSCLKQDVRDSQDVQDEGKVTAGNYLLTRVASEPERF